MTRFCIVACALALGGLAGPGIARAADPYGIEALSNQIQAAVLAEINAVAVQTNIPSAAPPPAETSASPVDESTVPIAATSEAAAAQAAAPIATMATEIAAASSAAPQEVASSGTNRAAAEQFGRSEKPHSVVRAAARTRSRVHVLTHYERVELSASRATAESDVQVVAQASVRSRATVFTSASTRARSPGTRSKREGRAGMLLPQPFPPSPYSPRPDLNSAGQSGGNGSGGSAMPLVLGILAGAFALFGFGFLSRVLPRPAFRKPGRIALPPWHPG